MECGKWKFPSLGLLSLVVGIVWWDFNHRQSPSPKDPFKCLPYMPGKWGNCGPPSVKLHSCTREIGSITSLGFFIWIVYALLSKSYDSYPESWFVFQILRKMTRIYAPNSIYGWILGFTSESYDSILVLSNLMIQAIRLSKNNYNQ